jgi:maltose O-acetyltransferase
MGEVSKIRQFFSALTVYGYNSFVTHVPSFVLRTLYLRKILRIKVGQGAAIHMGCFFTGKQISIGRNSVVNRNCYLDGRAGLSIGDNVSISPEVYIMSLTHDCQDRRFPEVGKRVVISDNVWIGARAIILPGVQLSKGCVVGAGSVVTKGFDPFSIVAGVPARRIGERNHDTDYSLRYFTYFNTDIQL